MSKEFNSQVGLLKDKAFRFASKMLNSQDDAQDVVQDLFEKLWKMRKELIRYQNLEAFSIKVTRNLCLDRLKHQKLKVQKQETIYLEQPETAHHQNYDEKDVDLLLKSFIDELPDKQRMVLHLRDVEGCDFQEIAKAMEIDVNAVRMNLSRGRKTIKERLIKTMNYGL